MTKLIMLTLKKYFISSYYMLNIIVKKYLLPPTFVIIFHPGLAGFG